MKRDAIAVAKVGRQKAEGLMIGLDGPTGHKFAQAVEDVLTAWEYPGIEAVTWDERRQDIAINGRPRSQNGKGVKAVFHSAFAVSVPNRLGSHKPLKLHTPPKSVGSNCQRFLGRSSASSKHVWVVSNVDKWSDSAGCARAPTILQRR